MRCLPFFPTMLGNLKRLSTREAGSFGIHIGQLIWKARCQPKFYKHHFLLFNILPAISAKISFLANFFPVVYPDERLHVCLRGAHTIKGLEPLNTHIELLALFLSQVIERIVCRLKAPIVQKGALQTPRVCLFSR